jgi:hypothetical protein
MKVFRRSYPHQLSDVGEYLDNKLTDIASDCSKSSSGKFRLFFDKKNECIIRFRL